MPASSASQSDVEHLYRTEHRWLVSWLRGKLAGSPERAFDFAQETFLRVLMRGPIALEQPRSYLRTIAHGLLVDHFRRQDLERAYLEYLLCVPDAVRISEEEHAILMETLQEIDRLLDGLPLKVRSVFLLSQIDELTYPQIAAQLGISVASVRKYMQKALEHCLEAL